MLVGFRNIILAGGMLFILLLLAGLFLGLYLLFAGNFSLADFSALQSNVWWFTYENLAEDSAYLWALVSIITIFVLILCAGFVLRILFRKTAAPELFFFIIFLFTFAFEGLRVLNILFYFYKVPLYLEVFNSRFVYFGRIFGVFMLFCASLYAVEMKYQKFNIVIGVFALAALLLAYLLPLDPSILLTNFLYRLGDESSFFFINFAIALFSILNFLVAAVKRQGRFLPIMFAVLSVLGGRELLFYTLNPWMLAAGLALVCGGIIVFSKQIDKIYLWF